MKCIKYLDNIVWELTLRCNAKCSHCGSAAGVDRQDNLTNDELLRVCDELAEVRCKKVTLIGGEVFLHPLWCEIVKRLSEYNIEIAIVTNALSLNEEKINFLSHYKTATIGISLDGASKEVHDGIRRVPGTFDHIFLLSEHIKKYKIPTIAISTVTKRNILELPKLTKLLHSSFFNGWQLQIGTPFGRLSKDATALNELEYYVTGLFVALMQIRHNEFLITGMHDFGYYSDEKPNSVNVFKKNWKGCPAGRYVMGIRSNGKILGCLSIYDDNYIEDDLRIKTIKEIWNSDNFCSWNTVYNRYKNLQGFCKTCDYATSCCGGCSGTAIAFHGNERQNKLCYHKIEEEYKNYAKDDEYGKVLKLLVNSSITPDGKLKLANNEFLNNKHIHQIQDMYLQNLLNMLL